MLLLLVKKLKTYYSVNILYPLSLQPDSEALRIVSYIGLAISLACLLLTIIFFITFGYMYMYMYMPTCCVIHVLYSQTSCNTETTVSGNSDHAYTCTCILISRIMYFFLQRRRASLQVNNDLHVCSYLCSKKLFTAVHNFVHLNLAIALFAGYLTFAVGVELAKDQEVRTLCTYVHVLYSWSESACDNWVGGSEEGVTECCVPYRYLPAPCWGKASMYYWASRNEPT